MPAAHKLVRIVSFVFRRRLVDEVVHQLRVSREATHNIRHQRRVRELPSRAELAQILEGLAAALFPTHYGRPNLTDESIDYFVGDTLNTTLDRLHAFIARIVSDIANSRTGIDIHPAARIGACFFIDHGTGVVIGETAIVGERVRLYQHVTLGAKRFPADASGNLIKGTPRHPIVEDDVVIYAGATVLGRITIGAGSTVGGNVWLTQSMPPNSNVSQAQMRSD